MIKIIFLLISFGILYLLLEKNENFSILNNNENNNNIKKFYKSPYLCLDYNDLVIQ